MAQQTIENMESAPGLGMVSSAGAHKIWYGTRALVQPPAAGAQAVIATLECKWRRNRLKTLIPRPDLV
jgi:hypothetical protein